MHSKVSGNTGWLVGLGISKHFGAVSALVFSLVLSACGGGSGGDGNTLTAVDGAPSLTSASISADDNATVTVGDVVTVTVTASEAIMAPSVTIGGSAATSVLGSGEDWTASRAMTADDTVGDISFSVSFSDISGESGESVSTSTDSSAVAFEINTQAGNAIDGPFQFAKAFGDYNGNGVHDENEPSSITDADGAYSLIEDTNTPETYTIIVEMTADTIDSVTGESFAGTGVVLRGSSAGAVVTPLTTLLHAAVAVDPTYTAADLAIDMALPLGVDIATYNPFAADADPAVAHEVEKVFQQVMTATMIVAEAMTGLGDLAGVQMTPEEASAAALKALASMVLASEVEVDLSDETQVAGLQAAAKTELAANGVDVSDAIADFVLSQASDTLTHVAAAFNDLSADDFGSTAASAISLLKHDATAELAAMSEAAATFLADAANSDLAAFDATAYVTLNTEVGIGAAVAENHNDVNEYLGTSVLIVYDDGVVSSAWGGNETLHFFDEANGYGDCTDEAAGTESCGSVDWVVVADDTRGDVLQVTYADDAQHAGLVLAKLAGSSVDASDYATGTLSFDIKVTDMGGATGFQLKLESGSTNSGEIAVAGITGSGDWETVNFSMETLIAGGLNAAAVNVPLVFFPDYQTGGGLVYQLDNVRFIAGEDDGSSDDNSGGDTGGDTGGEFSGAVFDNGIVEAAWGGNETLHFFDEANGYGDCTDEVAGTESCGSVDWVVVADDARGDVLQVTYADDAQHAGLVLAKLEGSSVDVSDYATGTLSFDIKVTDMGGATGFQLKLESGSTNSGEIAVAGITGSGDWETVNFSMETLIAGGLNAAAINVPMVFFPDYQTGGGLVYQLDNVRFIAGEDDGSDDDNSGGDTGGGDSSGGDTGGDDSSTVVSFTAKLPAGTTTARLHSEALGWDLNHPDGVASDNGDGTWTATIPAPWSADTNYKWVVDGAEEDLLDDSQAGYCVAEDNINSGDWGANRLYSGSGDVTGQVFGECSGAPGSGDNSGGDDGDTTLVAGDYIDFNDPDEQAEINFTQFGGTFTQFTQDPTDATKTVASTTKNADAKEWAGTTIDAGEVIFPLTETATTMTVRVYSPAPDMVVRLKLEESGDGTHSVETDAVTTVADAWETLTFDFSNQAEGTAALNTSYVFDKLSIYFNKGVPGADSGEVIFYWDSLTWVGSGAPVSTVVSFTAKLPAGTTTARLHSEALGWDLNHPDGVASDNGDGTWTATIPAPWSADTNYKWVVDGAEEDLLDDSQAGYCVAEDNINSGDWGANRLYTGSGDVTGQVFGECSGAPGSGDTGGDDSSTVVSFTAKLPAGTTTARLHSEALGWDLNHPDGVASDNGDGTWTATIPAPWSADTNYKWVVDGAEEDLLDDSQAGYCVAEDNINSGDWGANRLYTGSGDVTGQVFGECSGAPGSGDTGGDDSSTVVSFTAKLPAGTTTARLHSEALGWDLNHPDGVASDNGDGTWTATIPAPWSADTNYKWVVDGAEEDLLDDSQAGYCVAEDNINSGDWGANRLYTGSGDVTGQVFGECSGAPGSGDTGGDDSSTVVSFTAKLPAGTTTARLHSEALGWDLNHPDGVASDNGDGTWTATIPAPWSADTNYKWVVDGAEEDLLDDSQAGYCVAEDNINSGDWGANRLYSGSGDVTGQVFGECSGAPGSGDNSGGDDGDTTLVAGDYIDFNDPDEQAEINFTQFGGTFTQFTQDPTDATKTVASTTKNADAKEWAGTTIDAGEVIFPLTETATTMTVRVYSPAPDMVVRLKLEESGDGTHSVETDAVTTVADAWETLTFDFSNQAEGTAALNTSYVFDKLSIYFNKGVPGADSGEVIFYWDSLTWVGAGETTGGGDTGGDASGAVFDNGIVEAAWGGNETLHFFDEANGYGDCTDEVAGTESCGSVDWVVVADDARGDVLQVTYADDAQHAGLVLAKLEGSSVDVSDYATGTLSFDIKVTDMGNATGFKLKLESGSTNSGEIAVAGITGSGDWETVNFSMETLVAGGLNAAAVNVPMVFFPDYQTGGELVYQLDNVRFIAGEDDGSSDDNSSGGNNDSSAEGELVTNGGFESGDFSGWEVYDGGTKAVVNTDQNGGTYSASLSSTNGGGDAVIKAANLASGSLTTGQTATISFDLKGSMTGAGGVVFAQFFHEKAEGGTSNGEGILSGAPLALSSSWQSHSYTSVISGEVAGGVSLQLKAGCGGDACTVDAYFDNVSVTVK